MFAEGVETLDILESLDLYFSFCSWQLYMVYHMRRGSTAVFWLSAIALDLLLQKEQTSRELSCIYRDKHWLRGVKKMSS